jgi:penicillin-binding protein 2
VRSFGFGDKLGIDLYGEYGGFVPTTEWLDNANGKYWNWGTVISCAIGQGEMAATPLQMANLAAIVANRGYYYPPHIVRSIEGRDSLDRRFYERNYTMVDSVHFETIIDGMWMGVNKEGTSRKAYLPGLDVCGKTGTAQHDRYKNRERKVRYPDHSAFISFAPRNNPKIAIAVYIEHGGWGASAAVPIASLIEELYLTDTITRPKMVEEMLNLKLDYGYYDMKQKKYDAEREAEEE